MDHIFKLFGLIVGGSILASIFGAIFGALVSGVSEEFAASLFGHHQFQVSYCAAVGMIWGLFLGLGVMLFCVAITYFGLWFKALIDAYKAKTSKADKAD